MVGCGGAIGYGISGKLRPNLPVLTGTTRFHPAPDEAKTILNDASGLSLTPIHKHQVIKADYVNGLDDAVKRALLDAKKLNLSLSVGAARHSMGGQAIPRNGFAIDMEAGRVELDSSNEVYRVSAGARWSDVITALDPLGWSPKVMQANHDFGVAATFSVNAHGWPVPFGPMGSTVKAIRMVMPSGDLITCTREQNAELFSAAMGGYGLIGVITDLDVEMVKNTRLQPHFDQIPAEDFPAKFIAAANEPDITMAYGRMNVDREHFFEKAILVSYAKTDNQNDIPKTTEGGTVGPFGNMIFRGQLGNETLKSFRWFSETTLAPRLTRQETTRNSLLNGPVKTLSNRDSGRTDILHEYFIASDRFTEFLQICREEIPASYQELLNVTLRFVATDKDSVLSYAQIPRIAAVMSFSQEKTHRAEVDMQRMTERLISRILDIGGSYYLPYRPHASLDQFAKAYTRCEAFSNLKRRVDPAGVLSNNLWETYLRKI